MNAKLSALVFALGVAVSGAANAASIYLPQTLNASGNDTEDIGSILPNNNYVSVVNVTNAFQHDWIFDIPTEMFSGGSVSNVPINFKIGLQDYNVANITGLSVKLYNSSNDLILDLDTVSGSTANVKIGSGVFPVADNYYFRISGAGSAPISGAGVYSFAVTTAPVPETETWAMMLAGLGLVGLQLRRKGKVAKEIAVN